MVKTTTNASSLYSGNAEQKSDAPEVAILVWTTGSPEDWEESLLSLQRVQGVRHRIISVPRDTRRAKSLLADSGWDLIEEVSLAQAVRRTCNLNPAQILFVYRPVLVPPDLLTRASAWIEHDGRVGTVSFLSNSAGYLSFPDNMHERRGGVEKHNEKTITRLLREVAPQTGPVPVVVPEGGAVLLGSNALSTCEGFDTRYDADHQVALTDFSLRAAIRGFHNFFDDSTFVTLTSEPISYTGSRIYDTAVTDELSARHPHFAGMYREQVNSFSEPRYIHMDLARAKVSGLRILIDGTCLGPWEMGTQVQTCALINALAQHPQVQEVHVGLMASQVPAYARHALSQAKVKTYTGQSLTFDSVGQVDIVHRPYQPDSSIPWTRWRHLAKRSVITLQDLIAYRAGGYFDSADDWAKYRNALRNAVSNADAICSISRDVLGPIHEEMLNIPDDRLFVTENGIDHLDTSDAYMKASLPETLSELGWVDAEFLMVLGANYAHKNRDLALRVFKELKARRPNLKLILVGVSVPKGSTRLRESRLIGDDKDVLVLPDVSTEERNWFLRHARMLVYLTSAEGFGLVPFEAAHFKTPTLHVSFGPLRELIVDGEIPADWSLDGLVARAEALLTEETVRRRAIKNVLERAHELRWADTAEKVVRAYLIAMSKPARYYFQ